MQPEISASTKEYERDCLNFSHGSITGCPLIFEAFRRVYLEVSGVGDPPRETFEACAKLLIENVTNRSMKMGPLRGTPVLEQNLTARFASFLQHIYSSVLTKNSLEPIVEIGHQNKVLNQVMDVTMYHATDSGPHPRVIFEFSVGDPNKLYQLHAYVCNSDVMLEKSLRLIALGVVVVLPPNGGASTISFYGHYKVAVQDGSNLVAKVSTILLFSGIWNEDNLTRVLRVCDWFVKLDMELFHLPLSGLPQEKWPTVLMPTDGSTVYKSFDYRDSSHPRSRKPTLALKYLPDSRNIFLNTDLDEACTVISYTKIEGGHAPPNNKSAIGVIEGLRKMHENGDLHLDVKAGNCLFNGTDHDRSALIDFDFSRAVDDATYPENYLLVITDGERHPDAAPGGRGLSEHDTYALAAVLKASSPAQEFKEKWATVCYLVEAGQLADAVEMLGDQEMYELRYSHRTMRPHIMPPAALRNSGAVFAS